MNKLTKKTFDDNVGCKIINGTLGEGVVVLVLMAIGEAMF